MARLGVAVLKTKTLPATIRTLVLDGVRTTDRPAAIGYFILTEMREFYHKYHYFPQVEFTIGSVDTSTLLNSETEARAIPMTEDWFGKIYELIVKVERGDKTINS